jgi:hypothetical protein
VIPAGNDNGFAQYREDGTVPAALKEKVRVDLQPNERLVWIGQPIGSVVFLRSVMYLIVAGFFALVALAWLIGGLRQTVPPPPPAKVATKAQGGNKAPQAQPTATAPAPSIGPLPWILLAVAGGFMAVPVYRWRMAPHSCYALTNRRALVYKHGLLGATRESYSPLEVSAMRRSDSWLSATGGDLIFRTVYVTTFSRNRTGVSSSTRRIDYGFLAIPHVKEVEHLVRETLIDRFVEKLNEASAL